MTILADIADDFEAYALLDFGETWTHTPDPQKDDDPIDFTAIFVATTGQQKNSAHGMDAEHRGTLQYLAADLPATAITHRSRLSRAGDDTIYIPAGVPDDTHGVIILRLTRLTRQTFGRS